MIRGLDLAVGEAITVWLTRGHCATCQQTLVITYNSETELKDIRCPKGHVVTVFTQAASQHD